MAFNMKNDLWVCFTQDVERIIEYSPTGGPSDWVAAKNSTDSYCKILKEGGFYATLFVVPDTASEQRDFLIEKKNEGHELGMHFHDQSYLDHWMRPECYDYLGGYTAEEQKAKLMEAQNRWKEALGFYPKAMRGGNFSANDSTYAVLVEIGFTHGSVSQPGRDCNEYMANWEGACRDVHRAHKAFRHVAGDLDFVEIPATTDTTPQSVWRFGDIRIEGTNAETLCRVTENDIARQIKNDVGFKHLCYFTHNTVNYYDEANKANYCGDKIKILSRHIGDLCDKYNLNLRPATLAGIREAYLATRFS